MYARVLKIWYTMVIAAVVPGQWFMVSGSWRRWGGRYIVLSINGEFQRILLLNAYVTVLKASTPVLDNMYL